MIKLIKYILSILFTSNKKIDPIRKTEEKIDIHKTIKKNHFTIEEFIKSDTAKKLHINNKPTKEVLNNLKYTIECMEIVRKKLGNKPLYINSGYRSKKLNKAVSGAKNSQHLKGQACDFKSDVLTPKEICIILKKSDLKYCQLILEPNWVHISFINTNKPKRQFLDLTKKL